ncbi:hevamine-A-like [Nymphaea colorata]|nr:hevamine-A-like [Nymphaea colorata]
MVSAKRPLVGLLFVCFLVLSFTRPSNGEGKVGIYWGQAVASSEVVESSLKETCATGTFGYVAISFLDITADGSAFLLNLTTHCNSLTGDCTQLSSEITYCQELGVKVLLSIGDVPRRLNLTSAAYTQPVAEYLYNYFLGGNSSSRPLGDAVLDGIEVIVDGGSPNIYEGLAEYLKAYSTTESPIFMAAAPQCDYPETFNSSSYDIVWPQFYNDDCSLTTSWEEWAAKTEAIMIAVGLPTAEDAASGYMTANDVITRVLPLAKTSPKYGGVMLWNRYWDISNGNYSAEIMPYVVGQSSSIFSYILQTVGLAL